MESGQHVRLKSLHLTAVLGWEENDVTGSDVAIIVEGEQKRDVANDGEANVTFPLGFKGSRHVTIKGSESGEIHGTIEID